jgi:hypothetical protein
VFRCWLRRRHFVLVGVLWILRITNRDMSWVLCVRPTRVPLLAETAALCFGRRVVDSSDHNRDMSWVLRVRPTRVLLLAETAVLRFGRRVVDSSDHNRDMSWVLCVRPTRCSDAG